MSLIRNYSCSCIPLGEHTTQCYNRQMHEVSQQFKSLKKLYSQIRKRKLGNSEIYVSKQLYHYAITLTGHTDYTKILNSIKNSKMFGITHMCYGVEQNENDKEKGWYHIHALVRSTKYIDAKEVYVKNKKSRCDVKHLKKEVELVKWHRYIHKESKLGECCVDTDGLKIIFLNTKYARTTEEQSHE